MSIIYGYIFGIGPTRHFDGTLTIYVASFISVRDPLRSSTVNFPALSFNATLSSYVLLFCSVLLAVLDPKVGHTMDVLSPFIPVLCHSD